jgi:hypothetical protein
VDGTPNERQVGDKGIDGVIRFPLDATGERVGRAIVSVKGGSQLNPAMVRDLRGTITSQRAEMGVMIVMDDITRGMIDEVRRSDSYLDPITGRAFPRLQIMSVRGLLDGKRVDMPTPYVPYLQAQRFVQGHPTLPGFA